MWRGSAIVLSSIVALAFAAGCGGRSLRRATVGQVPCDARSIRISEARSDHDSRSWIATCNGLRHYCSSPRARRGQPLSATCTPEGGSAVAATPLPTNWGGAAPVAQQQPVQAPTPTSNVTRHDTARGLELRAWLPVGGAFKLYVVAMPVSHPGRALLVVQHAGTPDAHRTCDLRFMLDGEVVPPATATYEIRDRDEFISVQTEFALIERMAQTQRIVGRVCNDEIAIDEQGRAVLAELVARVREEAAFHAPPPPTSATPPPASATTR